MFRKSTGGSPGFMADCHTDTGKRPQNDDSHALARDAEGRILVVVADGLGGVKHGDYASHTVTELFRNTFAEVSQFDSVASYLRQTVFVASTLIMQKAMQDSEYANAATTLSGFVIDTDKNIYTVNVGDSRVYLFRQGKIQRLTHDHSKVQMLIDRGLITEEQAINHPEKNIVSNVIDKNLSSLSIDIKKHGKVQPGDILLATTDGFHDVLTDKDVEEAMKKMHGKQSLAKKLVKLALNKGSDDNVTVCVLRYAIR